MKKIKIKSLRIYDAVEINKAKENFLIGGEYAPKEGGFNRKYRHLTLAYYPDLHVVEIKDSETKFHSLVPSTNVAEMIMIPENWDVLKLEAIAQAAEAAAQAAEAAQQTPGSLQVSESEEPKRGRGRPRKYPALGS